MITSRRKFEPPGEPGEGLKVTWIGLLVNLGLIALKFWGGVVGRSQALIADGVHSVSDLFSDVVVYFGLRLGRKQADETHPYGHGRIETIASLAVGVILVAAACSIAYQAIVAIYEHRISNPSVFALVVAAVSILSKEVLYRYTLRVGRRLRSEVLIGNAWHHRSDALSSVAVLIGVGVALINPDWHIADSVAAIVVSVFIARVGFHLVKSALMELTDTAPDQSVLSRLSAVAEQTPGVLQVHDLKARRSGPLLLVEMHVVVEGTMSVHDGHEIAEKVEDRLISSAEPIGEVLVHVEPHTEYQGPESDDG
ncbi:MAG: cation transporter [Candidatus Zixiibacteriota bacterium]|nr:MAG: cation transporter [candidate division Zixibacteria bacterium]